jgi:hypothetical protein
MKRTYLICSLIGWHVAKNPSITAAEIKIAIDDQLIESHFTPLGSEPGDVQLLEELIGETMMWVIGQGWNRKLRRLAEKR